MIHFIPSNIRIEQMYNLYYGSALAIILVFVLLVQSYKSQRRYESNANIAVKTSQGLIKINQQTLSRELATLHAELSRHNKLPRTTKFRTQIDALINNLSNFIKRNPSDLSQGDLRGDIIQRVMSDAVSYDRYIQQANYNTILSQDDFEHGTDEERFDYLLKHVDILVNMLRSEICSDGICDLVGLENLLRKLDMDLSNSVSGNYETPLGQEIGNKYDPFVIPRLNPLHSSDMQLEGMLVESEPHTSNRVLPAMHMIVGAQNARNAQQRSQMFELNRRTLGNKTNYIDDDLLQHPTYEQLAL